MTSFVQPLLPGKLPHRQNEFLSSHLSVYFYSGGFKKEIIRSPKADSYSRKSRDYSIDKLQVSLVGCLECCRKEIFPVIAPSVRFVQFFMRLGCGKGVPDPRSQPVLLQYSLNGGLTWSLLQEFLFSNSSNVGRYIALEIPLKARSSSTRLRWWQPSENGHFYSPWVIDQVRKPLGCFF